MAKPAALPSFPAPSASQAEVDTFLREWVAARLQVSVSSPQVQDLLFRFKGTGATLYSLTQEEVQTLLGNKDKALGDALYYSLCYDSPYGSVMRGKYASVVSGLSNAARSFGPWIQDPSMTPTTSSSSSIRSSHTLEPARVPVEESYTRSSTSSISRGTRCLSQKPSAQYLNKFYVK